MTPEEIKKIKGKRHSQFREGLTKGVYLMYKKVRKDIPEVSIEDFRAIIGGMIAEVKERLMRGHLVELPHDLGTLVVKRAEHRAYVDKDGNLRNGYPVDWKRTLELWCADPEAREAKTKVHNMNKKSSLYLVFTPGRIAQRRGLDVQFKRERKFIFEVTAYADEHKEVSYPIKKRYYER